MVANITNKKVIYPEISFRIVKILFSAHNKLGRFCREKQYGDYIELALTEDKIVFEREKNLPIEKVKLSATNKADFIIDSKIVLEIKSKPIIERQDYEQIQRYLQAGNFKLGLLVNFRNRYLKPIRVIKKD